MKDKQKRAKLLDIVGVACGVFIVLVLVINAVLGAMPKGAGSAAGAPSTAQKLTGSAQGRNDIIEVSVTADESKIYSVAVNKHAETEGIGSLAVDELPGRIYEANSLAVDATTGATITSKAIVEAVADALTSGGIDPTAFGYVAPVAATPAPTADPNAIPADAQTLTGSAMGKIDMVTVEVVATAEKIYSVTVTSHSETDGIGTLAVDALPGTIYAENSLAVDNVSSASVTSEAIKAAVANALTSGGIDPAAFGYAAAAAEEPAPAAEPAPTAEPAPAAKPAPAVEIPEGAQVLAGTAAGRNGDVTVEVVADGEHIYAVTVTDHSETEGIGSLAVDALPGTIVAQQNVDVDGISSATVTSEAIKAAVKAALESGGISAAVFDGSNASAEAVEPKELISEYNVDVVVVGAGGAGMTAAIEAHDAGCSVVVLESQGVPGGNSVRSTGGMNAAPTVWQNQNDFNAGAAVEKTLASAEAYAETDPGAERIHELAAIVREQWSAYQESGEGYFDSEELFQLDTLLGGHGLNDASLVERLVKNSDNAIDWLATIGADLHNVGQFGGASVMRIHRPVDENGKVLSVGAYLVPILQRNVTNRGITLLTNTTATEILMADGTACGVKAVDADGNEITVNAKVVVLASGGFGGNNDMVAEYRPDFKGFYTTNAPGIQGQGIQMAQAVGADVVDMEQIQLHPTVHIENGDASLITEGLRGDGAIVVNQEGLRFYNELLPRDAASAAEFAQTGGYGWEIVDSRMYDASTVIQGYVKRGLAAAGNTYEELAEAMGLDDPAVFAETMEKWNSYVKAQEDPDCGRTSFANPLDQAPFYGIKVQPAVHHTMGGVKINARAQVISTEGEVIPGLFACGEVTGGIHGGNRLGGNAVADFVIFGRIAGTQAAAFTR